MKTTINFIAAAVLLAASNARGQPAITNQPQTQATAPGTTVTFTVGATGADPLAYQWQRNVGAGFFPLMECTNAVLVLTNVQSWDSWDYRVVVTNLSGARTSAVAHLYVMSPAFLTNRVVLDNFDDNTLTGWTPVGAIFEANRQFRVRGYWPGVITWNWPDTFAAGYRPRSWSLQDGQTLEWRVDLAGLNQGATAAEMELANAAVDGSYVFAKGRDFIHLIKATWPGGVWNIGHVVHEMALIPHTNVVMAFAQTRAGPNLILTLRILDKANPDAMLYERSVVDTPNVDRTLTHAELEAVSGMHVNAGSDIAAAPWTSFYGAGLIVWQYNYNGNQPAAEATFDNFELWTYRVPITRYVDVNSASPTPPYTNWATAATNIQDAVDAALPGDEVVVTNGTYAIGGRAVGTNLLVNRVAVDKPVTLRSVNGPHFTVIQGYQVPGTTNGDGAIRCVYLTNGASLSGFTLTTGATRTNGDYNLDQSGGGLWCESTNAMVSNCVLAGNSAGDSGGGSYGGTLNNCLLTGNSAHAGGGAAGSTLYNCTLTSNSAYRGGGVGWHNWMLTSALYNCIVYFNAAPIGANYSDAIELSHSCTTPMPTNGIGNITNPPLFVDYPGGNLRLQTNSPCINAGLNACAPGPTDLDGNPRIISGTVDIGAYEFQGPGSVISYAWLQRYGLPTDGSADFLDSDADGRNNWQEWRCQTDPTNPFSVLRLLSASPTGANVTVTWQSVAGVTYFLERSTNLSTTPPFTPLAPNLPGQPGTTGFTDTNAGAAPRLFYRVGVGN